MPSQIKKHTLSYTEIPNMFDMPRELYFGIEDNNISPDASPQIDKQQKLIDKAVEQIEKDLPRTAYIDFTGKKVSELKKGWLILTPDSRPILANGVYPNYTQGNNTGAVIGETIYASKILPKILLNIPDPSDITAVKICFHYINAKNQPAGFSFVAWGDKSTNGYENWIISTIQNTTASPQLRPVTVLTSQNVLESNESENTVLVNATSVQQELSDAINESDVFALVKDMFSSDGSLNSTYIDYLKSRIEPNQNIDDRYRKVIQLETLFELATAHGIDMNDDAAAIKQKIADNIHFFEDNSFISEFDIILNNLTTKLNAKPNATNDISEINDILESIAVHRAFFMKLADDFYLEPEKSAEYETIANEILSLGKALEFSPSASEQARRDGLNKLYQNAPDAAEYYAQQRNNSHTLDNELKQLASLKQSRFSERNRKELISLGLTAVLILATAVGLAFLWPIPLLALLPFVAILAVPIVTFTFDINQKEKTYHQALKEDPDDIFKIKRAHNHALNHATRPEIVKQTKPADDSINNKTRTRTHSFNSTSTTLSASRFAFYGEPNVELETQNELGPEQEREQATRPRSQTL